MRMLARSIIESQVCIRRQEVYKQCTETAQDISSILKSSPVSVVDGLKKILPLPGFMKG